MGTVAALFANGLSMVLLPFVVVGLLTARLRSPRRWQLVAVGTLAFLGSQVVHLPILFAWDAATRAGWMENWGTPIDAVILGALAALCEEPARALVFARVFPTERGRDAAILVGVGHGGIESLIFGGMAFLGALNLMVTRELTEEQLVALGTPSEQAHAAVVQIHAALAAPWYDAFAGVVERMITMPFHVACSILVMASLRRRSPWPFLVALAAHAIGDAGVVLLGTDRGTWVTEGGIAAFAVPFTIAVLAWAVRSEPREASS